MKLGIVFISLSALWSCKQAPVEFYKLNVVDSSFTDGETPRLNVLEYYVVVNPPQSMDTLAKIALAFSKLRPVEYPSQQFWINRSFMRESKATPRNFMETGERGGSIKFHGDDNLLGIAHIRSGVRDCWFVHIPNREATSPLDTCIDLGSTLTPTDTAPEKP